MRILSKPFGIFTTEGNATMAVMKNYDFIHEHYYEYAVIEKYYLNRLQPLAIEIQWYDLINEIECDKPECFDRIINFAIG